MYSYTSLKEVGPVPHAEKTQTVHSIPNEIMKKLRSPCPPNWGVGSHNKTILNEKVMTMGANVLERRVSFEWLGRVHA